MLNKKDLKKLREQIVLNSIYVSDYENDLGIAPTKVCDFFDGYTDYLYELASEQNNDIENMENDAYYEYLFSFDNIENLYNYYCCFCDFEPLA